MSRIFRIIVNHGGRRDETNNMCYQLGVLLAIPVLSQAIDTTPMIRVMNEHSGQYDDSLDTFTETKFYGPYQFRVLKDAIETQGETKDIDGRVFRTSDEVFYAC